MGYELLDIEAIEELPDRSATAIELSDHYVPPEERDDADGTRWEGDRRGPENVGLRVYFAAPGESLGPETKLHYHEEQEEIFYVVEGTLHVETPETEYRVGQGQALVVEPGSPQRAFNPDDADGTVQVLAIGAPSYSRLGGTDVGIYEPDRE